jgi:hypothetical protein
MLALPFKVVPRTHRVRQSSQLERRWCYAGPERVAALRLLGAAP